MDFGSWFHSIPICTRVYICTVFATTLIVTYNMLSPSYLFIHYGRAFFKFEIWRLITCFCFAGKFSFNFLIYLMMIYQKLSKFENEAKENRKYADFAYMIFIVLVTIHLFTFLIQQGLFLCMELIFALIYIDCKRNPEQEVVLYFWKMKNAHLPWAMLLLSVVTGGSIISDLVGIATGHIFYFLKDLTPVMYGWDIFKTPQFLVNWLDKPPQRVVQSQQHRATFTTLNNQNAGEASFRPGYSNNSSGNNTGGNSGFTAFSGRGSSWGS